MQVAVPVQRCSPPGREGEKGVVGAPKEIAVFLRPKFARKAGPTTGLMNTADSVVGFRDSVEQLFEQKKKFTTKKCSVHDTGGHFFLNTKSLKMVFRKFHLKL